MQDKYEYFIEVKWLCPARFRENSKIRTWDVPYTNRSDNYRTVTFECYCSMCKSMKKNMWGRFGNSLFPRHWGIFLVVCKNSLMLHFILLKRKFLIFTKFFCLILKLSVIFVKAISHILFWILDPSFRLIWKAEFLICPFAFTFFPLPIPP